MSSSCGLHGCGMCVLALIVLDHHSEHNDADPFQDCRGRGRCRSCCRSGNSNISNETIACNRTKKKNRTKSKSDRQSVHDPVLILAIVVRKTNVVGRDRTTIAPAACLPHSYRWSFVAILHVVVVVAVASGNVIVVANSALSLCWFWFIVIFCNVCTSS